GGRGHGICPGNVVVLSGTVSAWSCRGGPVSGSRALSDVLVSEAISRTLCRDVRRWHTDGECHRLSDFRSDSQSGWRSRIQGLAVAVCARSNPGSDYRFADLVLPRGSTERRALVDFGTTQLASADHRQG